MQHHERLITHLKQNGVRFWACDNVAEYVDDVDLRLLESELTEKFGEILDILLIDRETDPNSHETPERLAKMYLYELLQGRFEKRPEVTAFPNNDSTERYTGLINIRCEIISMCSHHHQPVKGVCYIGLIPGTHVIGLSKYARIAQWCARRGTLQEELTNKIAKEIINVTGTRDIGVYIQATHGCVENRGVSAHSSLTQTTVLYGQFYNMSVKTEWLDNIKMQQLSIK